MEKTMRRTSTPNLLKRMAVRMLLFGIPFLGAYVATRPAPPLSTVRGFIVCAQPTDRPGELRISLDPALCAKEQESNKGVTITPTVRSSPQRSDYLLDNLDKEIPVPF
jgi:CRISPR-associated Cas5-like protein